MDFHFITIFPELFTGVLETGVLGIAARKGIARYNLVNLRDFAVDRASTIIPLSSIRRSHLPPPESSGIRFRMHTHAFSPSVYPRGTAAVGVTPSRRTGMLNFPLLSGTVPPNWFPMANSFGDRGEGTERMPSAIWVSDVNS